MINALLVGAFFMRRDTNVRELFAKASPTPSKNPWEGFLLKSLRNMKKRLLLKKQGGVFLIKRFFIFSVC